MLDFGRFDPLSDKPEDEGAVAPSLRELGELTHTAMAQLGVEYRMVLSLRFYEDIPHSDIAGILGYSKLGARMQFFNAKRALTRELRRRGVPRRSFQPAIAAFGVITTKC